MVNPSSARNSCTSTCCNNKEGIKRGPWTPEEDEILADYIHREGVGRWRTLPSRAGLLRCGKSCRLRWMNYLRPSVKRGRITPDEEDLILRLHRLLGNRWALIAGRIPGRTDNEIKNYWNTHLSKKLVKQGIDPRTHKPLNPNYSDKSPSPSKIPPLDSSTSNPKPLSTLPLEAGNVSNDQTFLSAQHQEQPMDNSIADNSSQLFITNASNYVGNNGDWECINSGFIQTWQGENEEIFGGLGYYDDNIFSSYLDSLMDDDLFVMNQQL